MCFVILILWILLLYFAILMPTCFCNQSDELLFSVMILIEESDKIFLYTDDTLYHLWYLLFLKINKT